MAYLNVPRISVGLMVERVAAYYSKAILNHEDLKKLRAILLTGQPGVGKSEGIEQIREKVSKAVKRSVEIREIRLSNCSLVDIIGVFSPDEKHEYSRILKPEFFREPEDKDTILIYFFDELDKALPMIQAAALQLILDKKSFVHELPENSLIIAAGNPEMVEGEVFTKFKEELNNRFRHYYVEPDLDSWLKWADENQVNVCVKEYLRFDKSKLYFQSEEERDTAFPTPRSWKAVSDYMNLMFDDQMDIDEIHYDICGDIGLGTALEFEEWYRHYGKLPSVWEILAGRTTKYPSTQDGLYELINRILHEISNNQSKITLHMLENAFQYANRFPADFKVMFYSEIQSIPWISTKLLSVRNFKNWFMSQKEEENHGR